MLEHVEDDAKCMRELYRVMKKDGWGIMQVPIDSNRQTTYEDASIISKEDREKHDLEIIQSLALKYHRKY